MKTVRDFVAQLYSALTHLSWLEINQEEINTKIITKQHGKCSISFELNAV